MLETIAGAELKHRGFTLLKGLLDIDQDIQPVINEMSEILDWLIESLYSAGKITHRYQNLSDLDRLNAFVTDTGGQYFQHFAVHLPFDNHPAYTPMYLGPAMFNLFRSPRLLDALEQFIGPEISVNPLHFTRIKPPERLLPEDIKTHPNGMISQTNWHQDLWAFEQDTNETEVITVWVAMTRSTIENGCLEVVMGSHLSGELSVHCKPSPTRPAFKGIPDELITGERVPIMCEPGDVIVMDKLTEHHSLINTSDELRWSFDLRYQPSGQPEGQGGRPSWVARSKSNPELELTDPDEWKKMWRGVVDRETRDGISEHTRYHLGHPLCY